jgi:UDP-2,3-diacylglucosamine pyrophosphatase LpxH/adenine/guanine phosphoribosyltransferase-like PRPP-binding protein
MAQCSALRGQDAWHFSFESEALASAVLSGIPKQRGMLLRHSPNLAQSLATHGSQKANHPAANSLGAQLVLPFLLCGAFTGWVPWHTVMIFLAVEYFHEILHTPFGKWDRPWWWNAIRFAVFRSPTPTRHFIASYATPLLGSVAGIAALVTFGVHSPTTMHSLTIFGRWIAQPLTWLVLSLFINVNPAIEGSDGHTLRRLFWPAASIPSRPDHDSRSAVWYMRLLVMTAVALVVPWPLFWIVLKSIGGFLFFKELWGITKFFYHRNVPPPTDAKLLIRSNPPNHFVGEREPGIDYHRALFISDLHIGTKAFKADYFLDFLAHNEAPVIYIIGDFIDCQEFGSLSAADQQVIARLLERLQRGVQIFWITGNHDDVVKKMPLPFHLANFHVVREMVHVMKDRTEMLLRHGDEEDISIQGVAAHVGSLLYALLRFTSDVNNNIREMLGVPYWPLDTIVKVFVKDIIKTMTNFDELVANSAFSRGFIQMVHGHDHKGGVERIVRVINGEKKELMKYNSGEFVSRNSFWSESYEGQMRERHWTTTGSQKPVRLHVRWLRWFISTMFPQWYHRHASVAPAEAIYKMNDSFADHKIAVDYSWMKLGRLREITQFGDELIIRIKSQLGTAMTENKYDSWIVVGIDHRALSSASSQLASYVAGNLQLPSLMLTSERMNGHASYVTLDAASRAQAVRPVFNSLHDRASIVGHNVILIDDGMETGETQRAMSKLLAANGAASVHPFVVATFSGDSQDQVNRAALRTENALPQLGELLRANLTPFTARFIEFIGELSDDHFKTLLKEMDPAIILRLYLSALAYMGRFDLQKIDILANSLDLNNAFGLLTRATLSGIKDVMLFQKRVKWLLREANHPHIITSLLGVGQNLQKFVREAG